MSKIIDINKPLSEEDAYYLSVHERKADIARAKSLGTWPDKDPEVGPASEPEEPVSENTGVPEQEEDETNEHYANRLTVPQMRELIAAFGEEEEQANAPAKSAAKADVKAYVVEILDRIDREVSPE